MVEKNPRGDGEYLNSLARGLAVLRAFSRDNPEMTLTQIASVTDLNPAVVRRCLNTLCHLGYVGKKGKTFLLRPEVFSLGTAYIESMNLEEVVRPSLQSIRDNTGYSTALAVLSGEDILFLVYVSTKLLTRVVAGVGTRFPAYCTSAGRVLLAFQEKTLLSEYMQQIKLQAITDNTVTSKRKLQTILKDVEKNGFATVTGELDFGIVSVAVPVFDQNKKVIAAISCSTSTARCTEQEMSQSLLPDLRHAAIDIELALQRSPMLIHSITANDSR